MISRVLTYQPQSPESSFANLPHFDSINQGSKGNQAENGYHLLEPAQGVARIQLSSKKKNTGWGRAPNVVCPQATITLIPHVLHLWQCCWEQQGDQSGLNFWGVLLMAAKK